MRPASLRHLLLLGCSVGVSSAPGPSTALPFAPRPAHHDNHESAYADPDEQGEWTFGSVFGLQAAQTALTAGGHPRLRQLHAFAAQDMSPTFQRQVMQGLQVWLAEEPVLTGDETLALVRALAALDTQELARKHLKRLMVLPPKTPVSRNDAQMAAMASAKLERLTWASKTAALALARSNERDALRELGHWLRRPHLEAEHAALAVNMAPPQELAPLLDASGPVTTLLLRTLRQLRDPRAEGFLRGVIKRATAPVQAEAALALLAIGVEETQELAAHWLAQKELSAELLWASTHIQFHYGLPTRKAALLRLIEQAPDLALDVASAYTDVDLLVLGDHLSKLQHLTQRKQALTHLSRLEESAVPILKKTLLTTPELGVTAATLLARNPTATAATTLRELVAKRVPSDAPRHSALGLMALTVSALRGNADRAATLTLLERRLPHASGDELYAVKLGLAALDVEWALKCLASSAVQDASIAAHVLGLHGVPYRTRVLQRLGEFAATPFAPLALALSAALSALGPQDPFPQVLLSAWAESSLPVAYAAVWQLCTRLPVTSDARLAQWLTHSDSEIRAAAYLGLGANPEPAHTATLLAKLHDEVDSWGRRVLLAALAKRPAIPPVQRALQREKTYYPDPGIELLFGPSKASAGLDFWFEPEPQTEAVGATMKATTPTPEPSTATTWLTLTSTVYPPFSVMVTQDMPMLMFLPDQRSLDADLFRAHTFPAPTTTQASN